MNILVSRPLPAHFPKIGPDGVTSAAGVVSCPTCHDVHGTGIMPTGQGVGKLLRRSVEGGPDARRGVEICSECHPGRGTKHGTVDCLACHPPHTNDARETSCRKCHPVTGAALFDRHWKSDGRCGSCHKAHGTGPGGGTAEEQCFTCHPSTRKIRETAHASLETDACGACHPVHRDLPGFDMPTKLGQEIFRPDLPCLRCHREGGMGPSPGRLSHPVRTQEVPTNYGTTVVLEAPVTMLGRLKEGARPLFPLFDDSGKPSLSGSMGCLTCHDPHAGGMRDGRPSANAYLRDSGSAFLSEICAPCHRAGIPERIRTFHKIPAGAP